MCPELMSFVTYFEGTWLVGNMNCQKSSSQIYIHWLKFLELVQNTRLGLFPSMTVHVSVTTCDVRAEDHVVKFTRPSPSVFAYCKWSQNGGDQNLEVGRPGNKATTFNNHYFNIDIPEHANMYTCSMLVCTMWEYRSLIQSITLMQLATWSCITLVAKLLTSSWWLTLAPAASNFSTILICRFRDAHIRAVLPSCGRRNKEKR